MTAGRIFQIWKCIPIQKDKLEDVENELETVIWGKIIQNHEGQRKEEAVLKSNIFGVSGLWVRESNMTFNKWMIFNKSTTWSHL